MCGIAGIYRNESVPVDREALVRMTRMLVHRGPDEEGFYQADGIGLGHRRLSIIDLSTGQQPLCNEDGTVWTSFNGEIFNYIELRADLEKRGHRFKTHSDTETIVHLYEEYGLDFVDHLNGQFAIAVWDVKRKRLVLTRDRVGIRPLFYAPLPAGGLLFASEIKAILAHGAIKAEIDPAGVAQMSMLWVTIPPRTTFKGVEELGPGRMLVVEDGKLKVHQYWRHRFPDAGHYEDKPLSYWTESIREKLHDATKLQLRSDVPVATYLSGGLDSSIISSLVKRYHNNDLITFSVAFTDPAYDEREYQQQMVAYLGTDHRSIEVDSATVGNSFSDVIWFAERPMMRTAPAPLMVLADLVRRNGIKVVLTGEGADEIFGGYNLFREDKVRRFWARNPASPWRPTLLSKLYAYVKRDAKAEAFWHMFFRKGLEDTDNPYYSHRIRWENSAQTRRAFSPEFREQMPTEAEIFDELDAYLDKDRERWHPLCRAQYLELTLFMSCYLLNSQGDRMMMGRSIEGRVPFLDHNVIEFAATLPPKYKINGLEEKYALKRAFTDLLPAEIANRPKKPYRAPIAPCFANAESNLGAKLIQPEALAASGLVNVPAFGKLMQKAVSEAGASERDDMTIATVVSMQLLHHHFVTNFPMPGAETPRGIPTP
jgi:asparagine synthase (glutamine-hydrolysing)